MSQTLAVQDKPHLDWSIYYGLLSLVIPLVLTNVISSQFDTIDVYLMKWIGTSSQAAAGVSEVLVILYAAFFMGLFSGVTILTAHLFGEGNKLRCGESFWSGLWIALFASIFLVGFGGNLWRLLAIFGAPKEVIAIAKVYLSFRIWAIPIDLLLGNAVSFLRGLGDTKTPLKAVFCGLAMYATGGFCFTFGWFGLPEMGIISLAIATICSSITQCIVIYSTIFRSTLRKTYNVHSVSFSILHTKKVLHYGIPSGTTFLLELTNNLSSAWLVSRLGKITMATNSILAAVNQSIFSVNIAFLQGVIPLIGQNFGAKNYSLARKYVTAAFRSGLFLTIIILIILLFFANTICGLFTKDPLVLKAASEVLWIVAVQCPMQLIAIVCVAGTIGSGSPLLHWLGVLLTLLISIPLQWTLGLFFHFGVKGIWMAIGIREILAVILFSLIYRYRKWEGES